jgi:hypothetical protein
MLPWPMCPARNNMKLMNRILQQLSLKQQASRLASGLAIFAVSMLAVQPLKTLAQGTAFTYQGRLTDSGTPATGTYDFTFQVFDAASNGTSQGGPLSTNGMSVAAGLFTVTLDFGAGPFSSGAPRWLEIAVRTNGGLVFGTISPRTPLTAAPYAITAGNLTGVVSANGLSGIYSNAVTLSNPTNSFVGNGAGLTNLNGTNIAANTIRAIQLAPNSVDSSKIAAGSIFDAQISPLAAISDTKLGTISTPGKVANSALSSSVSLLGQSIDSSEITDNTIMNVDINSAAGIVDTKLATIVTPGKVSDSALSTNVDLLNTAQTFTADKAFGSGAQLFADSGLVSAPGLTFNGDGDTGIFHPVANTLAFVTGGAEQMRINSAGNVGIGTPSPSRELEVQNPSDVEIGLKSTDTGGHLWTVQSSGITGASYDASFQVIDRTPGVNGSRMTIRTNGDVGIGTSGPSARLHVAGGTDVTLGGGGSFMIGSITGLNLVMDDHEIQARNNGAAANLYLNYNGPTGNGPLLVLGGSGLIPRVDNNENCGDLTHAWTDVISYHFDGPSDRRLKDHIEPLRYGLQTILALRPVSYQWKNKPDGRVNLGLIAQEVEPVVPEVVTKGKDPEYLLALQYNGLIPILIKAVQEQQALIAEQRSENVELKARLERLEKLITGTHGQ